MRATLLLSICIAIFAVAQASGAIWYVDDSVSPSVEGKSPATAFKKIQEGIDAAVSADTVIVAEGTYVENIRLNGKNIALQSEDPTDPAVVARTIIDGNQMGSVVIFLGTEDESCILSGFTIQNGKGEFDGKYGGGIYGGGTHATIRNNRIVRNRAPST